MESTTYIQQGRQAGHSLLRVTNISAVISRVQIDAHCSVNTRQPCQRISGHSVEVSPQSTDRHRANQARHLLSHWPWRFLWRRSGHHPPHAERTTPTHSQSRSATLYTMLPIVRPGGITTPRHVCFDILCAPCSGVERWGSRSPAQCGGGGHPGSSGGPGLCWRYQLCGG